MNALPITLALAFSTGTATWGQPAGPTPVARAALRAASPAAPTAVEAADDEPPSSDCLLPRNGSERATVAQCTACHAQSGSNHPAGLDYARAVRDRRRGSDLRDAAEVVRRGVFLPEGELRCVTCHDRRSPWRWHIALPPGTSARPAVDPHTPATYDPAALDRSGERNRTPAPGSPVSPKPLCLACHAMD